MFGRQAPSSSLNSIALFDPALVPEKPRNEDAGSSDSLSEPLFAPATVLLDECVVCYLRQLKQVTSSSFARASLTDVDRDEPAGQSDGRNEGICVYVARLSLE